jgi:hypothetical protein
MAKKTLFFPSKYKKYSEIVRLDSELAAEDSVRKLKEEFNEAKTREKEIRIMRVTVLAANRAAAMAKNPNISEGEKRELKAVSRIYAKAADTMMSG